MERQKHINHLAYKFQKLESHCQINSGKSLFFKDSVDICEFVNQIEKDVMEIRESNQFIIPERIRVIWKDDLEKFKVHNEKVTDISQSSHGIDVINIYIKYIFNIFKVSFYHLLYFPHHRHHRISMHYNMLQRNTTQ